MTITALVMQHSLQDCNLILLIFILKKNLLREIKEKNWQNKVM